MSSAAHADTIFCKGGLLSEYDRNDLKDIHYRTSVDTELTLEFVAAEKLGTTVANVTLQDPHFDLTTPQAATVTLHNDGVVDRTAWVPQTNLKLQETTLPAHTYVSTTAVMTSPDPFKHVADLVLYVPTVLTRVGPKSPVIWAYLHTQSGQGYTYAMACGTRSALKRVK